MTDISKEFQKLVDTVFIRYRGCLLEKIPEGFLMWERKFKTLEEVDEYLDAGLNRLAKGINELPNRFKNQQ